MAARKAHKDKNRRTDIKRDTHRGRINHQTSKTACKTCSQVGSTHELSVLKRNTNIERYTHTKIERYTHTQKTHQPPSH